MSGIESGLASTTRTPLRSEQSGNGRCLMPEDKWRVGGPLCPWIPTPESPTGRGSELKGGRMRTTDVDRTELCAVGFDDGVGEPGRGGLAEGQRLFGDEVSPSGWSTRGESAGAVII